MDTWRPRKVSSSSSCRKESWLNHFLALSEISSVSLPPNFLVMKPEQRLAILTYFPTRSLLTRSDKILKVEVNVLHAVVELGSIVIAQPFGIQALFQIALRRNEGSPGFGHFLSVHSEKPVSVDLRGGAIAGEFQHGGPEQGVKVEDILPYEVHHFRIAARTQEFIDIDLGSLCFA